MTTPHLNGNMNETEVSTSTASQDVSKKHKKRKHTDVDHVHHEPCNMTVATDDAAVALSNGASTPNEKKKHKEKKRKSVETIATEVDDAAVALSNGASTPNEKKKHKEKKRKSVETIEKKKKQKKPKSKDVKEVMERLNNYAGTEELEEPKKKKKKQKNETQVDEDMTGTEELEEPKKKKKMQKNEKQVDEDMSGMEEIEEPKKKKKKQKKEKQVDEDMSVSFQIQENLDCKTTNQKMYEKENRLKKNTLRTETEMIKLNHGNASEKNMVDTMPHSQAQLAKAPKKNKRGVQRAKTSDENKTEAHQVKTPEKYKPSEENRTETHQAKMPEQYKPKANLFNSVAVILEPSQTSSYTMTEIKATKKEMNDEEQQILFDKMLKILPQTDTIGHKQRLDTLDWDLVKFDNFTADDCCAQWDKIYSQVRKSRTLMELIHDAQKEIFISKRKGSPSKKPLTPVNIFIKENRESWLKAKKMTESELLKEGAQRYHSLSSEEKSKYIDEFQRQKEEFLVKETSQKMLNEVRRVKPMKHGVKCSALQYFLNDKLNKYISRHPDITEEDIVQKYHNKWEEYSDEEKVKVKYIRKALAHNQQCQVEIEKKRQEDPMFKPPKRMELLSKEEFRILKKADGIPEKPPQSGYLLFCENKKECVKQEMTSYTEMMSELGHRWSALSKEEQETYKKEADKKKLEYKEYLKTHPEVDAIVNFAERAKSQTGKLKMKSKAKLFTGEPAKPPTSGYQMFCKEILSTLTDIVNQNRMQEASKKWASLSDEEKAVYNVKTKDAIEQYNRAIMKFKATLSPDSLSKYEELHKKQSLKKTKQKKSNLVVKLSDVPTTSKDVSSESADSEESSTDAENTEDENDNKLSDAESETY